MHRNDNECTPEKIVVDIAVRNRKATRQSIARRRNGHYTSPSDHVKTGNTCAIEGLLFHLKYCVSCTFFFMASLVLKLFI